MQNTSNSYIAELLSRVSLTDVLDILIVAFLIYKLLSFIKETRAEQLAKGILLFVLVTLVSQWLHLYTLHYILSRVMTVGLIAIVVIFQPELRRGLEYLGRTRFSKIFNKRGELVAKSVAEEVAESVYTAINDMADTNTGALIVIERDTQLSEIADTGTKIDAKITNQMIGNIFYKGAPLHDGALIIRGGRLLAAGCVLPLTDRRLASKYGTRHRAALGMSENSDAVVFVVSEETGEVSMAVGGKYTHNLSREELHAALIQLYTKQQDDSITKRIISALERKEEDNAEK